ncbi:MAG: hypothetical protein M3T55_07975 [Pseudomonadota bacterium]|nr:hypothetical protein [Pseudomonadota bacterium]
MTVGKALGTGALAVLAGCVTRTHVENAALTMPWPKPPSAELLAYAPPNEDYPSIGGDILKGASPAEQAAARAAATRPLAERSKP